MIGGGAEVFVVSHEMFPHYIQRLSEVETYKHCFTRNVSGLYTKIVEKATVRNRYVLQIK